MKNGKTRSKPVYTVLVVDDHPIVRHGLCRLISNDAGLHVCGEAGAIQEAVKAVECEKPDMAIIDISIGRSNGLDLVQTVRKISPETRILVLSMHDEKLYAERAIRLGAKGYLMKHEATDKLMHAVRKIMEGGVYLSESMASLLFDRMRFQPEKQGGSRLSPRENDILECIGRGLATKEIAAALGISPKTVEAHKAHIKTKLGLESAGELRRHAVERRVGGFSP